MRLRFTQAARKHRIGRQHVRYLLATTVPMEITTNRGEIGWLYRGVDDRGLELEVIAVETGEDELLVVHVMPAGYRRD